MKFAFFELTRYILSEVIFYHPMQRTFNPNNQTFSSPYPALKAIILITIGVFIAQAILDIWFHKPFIEAIGALSPKTFKQGFIWRFLTYGFIHGSFLHIFFNMLVIFFLGRILEPVLGSKRFLQVYLFSIILGGITWLLVNYGKNEMLVGASAGGFGLMTLFCLMHPDRPITVLLFFIIPLSIRPRILLWSLLIVELFLFFFYEIPGRTIVASSAHLGGILAGFITFQLYVRNLFKTSFSKVQIESPTWLKGKVIHKADRAQFTLNITNKEFLKQEVDRILDKINHQGFGSLTQEEKDILDKAKDILKK